MQQPFDVYKYLGTWCELAHYPSWFQRNDNYNTTANYELDREGNIIVTNSTISAGKRFTSVGKAVIIGEGSFRVDFPINEMMKIRNSYEFNKNSYEFNNMMPMNMLSNVEPNYVIDKLWTNADGDYIFAVVTDPTRDSFYLLSRNPHPKLEEYNVVMQYVVNNFDRDRLVQSPYF